MGSSYRKPLFNRARGTIDAALMVPPPFSFPGVTARVFPLRANMNVLRSFCRSYLNVAKEVCEFHPYAPYVFLVVLDYGRMAAEEVNLGWVSQHEIYFAVPLGQWLHPRRGGSRRFQGWMVNTPFIFVNAPLSLSIGREVYGWQKVLVDLSSGFKEWLIDPRSPARLLTMDVRGFGSHATEVERLLEIDQQLGQNASLFPPDFEVIDPFERLSRITRTSWLTGLNLTKLFLRSPLAGFGPQDPGGQAIVLLDSLRKLFGFYNAPYVDALTLKQFPDAEHPSRICYQALVQSRMNVSRYNCGGLLGLYDVLRGDITGGFRIRLRHHPFFPIVESLGLEVAREQTAHESGFSILEPFFPFWISVDLTYGRGDTICWRAHDTPWFREGVPVPGSRPQAKKHYNTFAGAAHQVWSGPFSVCGADCDVFPLRANPKKLTKFVEAYLNVEDRFRFEPWGEHVYMVALSGRILSPERSAAWIDSCLVSFNVPIRCYAKKRGAFEEDRFLGFAMARPFVFVENPILAMTLREVQGIPATDATIETPSHSWLGREPVLRVRADVFLDLDAGLQSERRTLIELVEKQDLIRVPPTPVTLPAIRKANASCKCENQARKLLQGKRSLRMLALKQFRDVEEPNHACYQALVHEPWRLSKLSFAPLQSIQEIRIYQYPSFPLAKTLGLDNYAIRPPQEMRGAIAYAFKPEKPFRIKADLEIGTTKRLSFSADVLSWQLHAEDVLTLFPDFNEAAEISKECTECTPQALIKTLFFNEKTSSKTVQRQAGKGRRRQG